MKIGITGASGFLGSYLVNYLAERNLSVICLSRSNSLEQASCRRGIELVIGDLNSKAVCRDFVGRSDVVIHLAHSNSPLNSNSDVLSDATLNLLPSLNLLEAMKESSGKKHLIYASSGGSIYGSSSAHTPFTELAVCSPRNSYGIQKLTIENYIRMYASAGWLYGTILRISNPYGTLLPLQRRQGLIGVSVSRMIHQEAVQIYGKPNNVRDYIHLSDMCRAIMLSIENPEMLRTYNIGSGKGHSVADVLVMLEKHLGFTSRKEFIETPETLALCDWSVLDIQKAGEELGWTPQIDLNNGLKDLCAKISLSSQ